MAVRSEREKSKMQEKYQMVLSQMLKEDDNRFCVDCDTKSNVRSASDAIVHTVPRPLQVHDGQVGILAYSSAFVAPAFIEISVYTYPK